MAITFVARPGMVIAMARNDFHRWGDAGHHRRQAVLRRQLRGENSVPTRRLSMRKIKEVLRLHFELGMGQRKIARSCAISQSTVHDYLKAARAAGVS
jgi:DNA-directed RNA polymerase specialized sigma subunit